MAFMFALDYRGTNDAVTSFSVPDSAFKRITLWYTCTSCKEPSVMSEKKPQSYANHVRWDPLFHFFALPVFLLLAIAGLVHFIWRPGLHSGLMFVGAVALASAVFKIRAYAVKVQDRVILLEERLRLSTLCSEALRSRIPQLTEDQIIALRFASDAELPKLAERALSEKLSRTDIKKAIQTWRPDYWRV
jgi:Family of unknown function (DUF6526)